MKKSYIYPYSYQNSKLSFYNPYIDDLIQSFSKFNLFINSNKPSKNGVFDILKYINRIDYIFFNWVEKLPDNKGGKIQTLFLLLLLPIFKLFRIKVVWTMHNKLSHSLEHVFWKKLIFKNMLKYSDVILTHSNEGIKYGKDMVSGSEKKIHYYPHPAKDRRLNTNSQKVYDLLIWGTISPYKGIDKFLEYIYQNELSNKYKILIVGKITTDDYKRKLGKYQSSNIQIENKFIEDELLQKLISKSKIVLFTYSQSSILSSGVLMDSLGYGANIVGPDVGAFTDLANEDIINVYTDFPDMFKTIDEQLNDDGKIISKEKIDSFLIDNSWNKFASNISNLLK